MPFLWLWFLNILPKILLSFLTSQNCLLILRGYLYRPFSKRLESENKFQYPSTTQNYVFFMQHNPSTAAYNFFNQKCKIILKHLSTYAWSPFVRKNLHIFFLNSCCVFNLFILINCACMKSVIDFLDQCLAICKFICNFN